MDVNLFKDFRKQQSPDFDARTQGGCRVDMKDSRTCPSEGHQESIEVAAKREQM